MSRLPAGVRIHSFCDRLVMYILKRAIRKGKDSSRFESRVLVSNGKYKKGKWKASLTCSLSRFTHAAFPPSSESPRRLSSDRISDADLYAQGGLLPSTWWHALNGFSRTFFLAAIASGVAGSIALRLAQLDLMKSRDWVLRVGCGSFCSEIVVARAIVIKSEAEGEE